jgi:hypothetical protein
LGRELELQGGKEKTETKKFSGQLRGETDAIWYWDKKHQKSKSLAAFAAIFSRPVIAGKMHGGREG